MVWYKSVLNYGTIAQPVEQQTLNLFVVGSIPTCPILPRIDFKTNSRKEVLNESP